MKILQWLLRAVIVLIAVLMIAITAAGFWFLFELVKFVQGLA